MRVILFLLQRSPRALALACAGAATAGVAMTGLVALINALIADPHATGDASHRAATFVGLCAMVLLTNVGAEAVLIRLTQQSVFSLRTTLGAALAALPLGRFERIGAARVHGALTDDVTALSVALGSLPMLATNLAAVLACLAYLGWLSPPMLVALLVFMALGMASHRIAETGAERAMVRARIAQQKVHTQIRALTEGAKEVRLSERRRAGVLAELEQSAGVQRDESGAAALRYALTGTWGQLLFFIAIGMVLALAQRAFGVPANALPAFALVIIYMTGPLRLILGTLPLLGRARVALDGLEAMRLVQTEEQRPTPPVEPAPARVRMSTLELRGVTYAYDRFVLGPIDLTLNAGEIVFLAGGNGSGKSTLAKLLTGLYRAESGEIEVDGRRVGDDGEWYRRHFTAIFADGHVFDSLVGAATPDRDAAARALLQKLELHDRVEIEGGRFSTTLLSDGQRKRLALVGALLDDAPICVFDEWAANQDPRFKAIFYRELLPELRARGKTVLAVTHDDRYFDVADRLIELEEGRLRVKSESAT